MHARFFCYSSHFFILLKEKQLALPHSLFDFAKKSVLLADKSKDIVISELFLAIQTRVLFFPL